MSADAIDRDMLLAGVVIGAIADDRLFHCASTLIRLLVPRGPLVLLSLVLTGVLSERKPCCPPAIFGVAS